MLGSAGHRNFSRSLQLDVPAEEAQVVLPDEIHSVDVLVGMKQLLAILGPHVFLLQALESQPHAPGELVIVDEGQLEHPCLSCHRLGCSSARSSATFGSQTGHARGKSHQAPGAGAPSPRSQRC